MPALCPSTNNISTPCSHPPARLAAFPTLPTPEKPFGREKRFLFVLAHLPGTMAKRTFPPLTTSRDKLPKKHNPQSSSLRKAQSRRPLDSRCNARSVHLRVMATSHFAWPPILNSCAKVLR